MDQKIYSTLKQFYGYDEFRPLQKAIVTDVLNKQDVFVLIPTGGGKSLCYQLPALIQSGITIVISPLIALMKDQVDGLLQNGAQAAFFNSSLSNAEKDQVKSELQNKKIQLLYVAPERLMQPEFLELIKQLPISLFAIDEAHCISDWGHDFRPEYRKLSTIKSIFPQIPIIALTATATERVKEDIIRQLKLEHSKKYQASFNRPNLSYQIEAKYDTLPQILEYLKSRLDQSGIIYCHSRNNVDTLAKSLQQRNINALPYHAGLSDEMRKNHQDQFIKQESVIIVATVAFGMGIDKPNVRFVIHADLPSNIERYYQETGRAGRDGLPSECLLLFNPGDKEKIKFFINQKTDPAEQQIANTQLISMLNFASSNKCRRAKLLEYFGEKTELINCQNCDNCLHPKETFDATIVSQKILSCIFRVGQRFGAKYISDILTGKKGKQLLQNNHQKLSTYGIVKDFTVQQLQGFIQELIQEEYIEQTEGKYPILKLTPKSTSLLKNQSTIHLAKPTFIPITLNISNSQANYDGQLFNILRALRKELADQQNVPPYIIFSDIALQDMSTYFPQTKEQFSQIKGVGAQKLEQYGPTFIKEISDYCQQKGLKNIPNQKKVPRFLGIM
jgi:ATP-dependent DNA helicase RecQ